MAKNKKLDKILIDCRAFDKKGSSISVYLFNLLKSLLKNNRYEYILVINNKKYKDVFKGENLKIICSSVKNNLIWDNLVIPYFSIKEKADLIFYPKTASSIFKIPGKKIVVTIHGMIYKVQPETHPFWINWYWRGAGKISSIISNQIIVVSKQDKKDLLSEGYSEQKMKVIPIGVNDIFYQQYSQSSTKKVLSKYNLKKNNYFVQVGHITQKKNHKFTLKLLEKHLSQDSSLKAIFVGRPDDKKLYNKLQEITRQMGISGQVVFSGAIDQNKQPKAIPILLQNSILSFFPSTYEGFGIPAVEAMAAETPMLCSNRGSLPEVVGKELTLPLENRVLWLKKIDQLINNRQKRQERLKKQKIIADKYRWNNISKEYLKTFNKLLS
jgi:glycosyltransferase involved in cell wall biosynthesis